MMTYQELKQKHSREISDFDGIFWAFSNEQFFEGIKKLGIEKEKAKNELYQLGAGGFILKSRHQDFKDMFNSHEKERKELRKNEKELINALLYELSNHEYGYTGDHVPAVEALGFDEKNPINENILKKAIKLYNELNKEL